MKQHHIVNVLSKQIRIAFGIQSASFLSKINGVIQCETCKTAREYGGHVSCSINSYQSPRVNTGILSAHDIFHTRVRVRVNYRLPVPRYPGILTSLLTTAKLEVLIRSEMLPWDLQWPDDGAVLWMRLKSYIHSRD